METSKKDTSILPTLFPGSVGLSNPLSDTKTQQQTEIKRKASIDNATQRSARTHTTITESTVTQTSTDPGVTKTTTVEIVRHASLE